MSNTIIFRPPSGIIVDPAPHPDLATRIIARRARVTLAHAAVVAQLAGIGPHAQRAAR